MMDGELESIGPVAAAVGLSVRTIRYYEEMGLIVPSGRTVGGFRLYNATDVARLMLIKRMKPLGYPLEAMAELLRLIDSVGRGSAGGREEAVEARSALRDFAAEVAERVEDLRTKLAYAEEFRDRIQTEVDRADRLADADDAPVTAPAT